MKFLVFQHAPHEHTGLIKKFADSRGVSLDTVELWKPYRIPTIENYDALIIMGGPMGVYEGKDTFPSKEDELKTIKKAVGKIPILGFCLGSQLLAAALGAEVYPNIQKGKKIKEIGYYEVNLTGQGLQDRLFKGFSSPLSVLQWHGDIFELPSGVTLLATGEVCPNQAFCYKNAYGLLFHFEFTPEMIAKQIEVDKEWIHADFELDESELLRKATENAVLMERECQKLFDNFLSIVETPQKP